MQLKILTVKLTVVLITASLVSSSALFPQYCAECEQEVWEEVPCSEIPSTTLSPYKTTTELPPTTTIRTTTTQFTTIAPTTIPTTTPIPITTTRPYTSAATTENNYQKCYCECKVGCKEFCRKVIISGPKQNIVLVSSTGEKNPSSEVEFTHVHQRKVYSKTANDYNAAPVPYEVDRISKLENYLQDPQRPPTNAVDINAPIYNFDELTSSFKSDYLNENEYLSPRAEFQTPYKLVPVYNKVDADRSAENRIRPLLQAPNYSSYINQYELERSLPVYNRPNIYSQAAPPTIRQTLSLDNAIDSYLKGYLNDNPDEYLSVLSTL